MPYVIYRDMDVGTIEVTRVPTQDRAEAIVRDFMAKEHARWLKIRERQPDFPREALDYYSFRYEK